MKPLHTSLSLNLAMNLYLLLVAFTPGLLTRGNPLLHCGPQLLGELFPLGLLLAQASFDSALTSFISFLTRILLLIGVAVVALGGWLIAQGKNSDGILAIIGGFVIAAAVPIVRLLAQITGSSF